MRKPYLIAEIGVNFYDTARVLGATPLEAAKLYIDEAAAAGVDAVKFQSYKAGTIASKNSPSYWDLNAEPTTSQYELFKKFDSFGRDEYVELCDHARICGVDFMSTPFDFESADYLDEMIDVYKISSSDITNLPFLHHIARKGKPVYLSTGASYLSEVDEAYRTLMDAGCEDVCLLHCVLSYPTKTENANLAMIRGLKAAFPNAKIGYSDHTLPDPAMAVLTAAFLYGAEVIEKHFTLDKTLPGNDHYHAADPDDIRKTVASFELICEAEGQSEKTVLACEAESRKQARRSIVFARDMKAGEIITENDIAFKRPGTGIGPGDVDKVVGRALACDVDSDEIAFWDALA